MSHNRLPQFPYGGVYYRNSSPPPADWERDYQQAARDGMNCFRHWVLWSAIETAPGVFEWDDYDRQLDLAAKYGIKTIMAECAHAAPEWVFAEYGHSCYQDAEGNPVRSQIRNSTATGGYPGLCLDHEDVRALAGRFLTKMAERYRDHPGMGGYDVWNEINLGSSAYRWCYCPATIATFREWLQQKYGSIRELAQAWRRHSYSDWSQVLPSPSRGPYPDFIDWVNFRIDNAYRLLRWRIDTIRNVDPDSPITGHGVQDATLWRRVEGADDAWRAAQHLDVYGYSGGASQTTGWRWWRMCLADMGRAGAGGKDFWAAEVSAGPAGEWFDGDESMAAGRIRPTAQHLRMAQFSMLTGGARGLFSHRWRSLIDGPMIGWFGYYSVDGSPTSRAEMAGRITRWANAPEQTRLWQAHPATGDVGILVIPETQVWYTLYRGDGIHYAEALRGVYQAFMDNNIQPDWVSLDGMSEYDILYLPIPFSLSAATVEALKQWVADGGCLVAEGCPGYVDETGRVAMPQQNHELDELFGVTQRYMEFAPARLGKEQIRLTTADGCSAVCSVYRQAYECHGGRAAGTFAGGQTALVDHDYDKGRTRLIGSTLGQSYWNQPDAGTKLFVGRLLSWAGKTQHVMCSNANVAARLHQGSGGTYLWIINPTEGDVGETTLVLSQQWGPYASARLVWGDGEPVVCGHTVRVHVPALDAVVLELLTDGGKR